MKRVLSLILVLSLVLGMVPAGFAADKTAGEQLKELGLVKGDQNGALNESADITRAEMMVVLARLLGKFDEASKFATPSLSTDVKGHWAANYIAFAEKEAWTAGKGAGVFAPNDKVTVQEAATFMMKALGYTVTDFAKVVEEATKLGIMKGITATTGNAPRSLVFSAALNTLNTTPKDGKESLGVKLGVLKATTPTAPVAGPLAVDKVVAAKANAFTVTFKNVVADTTKVTFAVKRETTVAAVTTTWDTAKTVATLTYASKLPEGNFEVTVNDITVADKPVVVATNKIVIEKEKIAKVEVGTETLLRYNDTMGYAPYKILNQYNEDVTNTTLGRSVNVLNTLGGLPVGAPPTDYSDVSLEKETGIVVFKYLNGLTKLRTLPSIVFTIQDASNGFVFTKTLKVSDTANAIGEVKVNGIVNEKGEKVDFIWSLTKAYYLDVTILDTNGQAITANSVLGAAEGSVKVLQVRPSNTQFINASVAAGTEGMILPSPHPQKAQNAAFRVDMLAVAGKGPSFDTPVTFSVIAPFGTSGKNNATFTTTLKRAAKVEKFTMLAPAEIATPNRPVEFFFEAFDQNGDKVTAYDDLDGMINFSSTAMKFIRQTDGSAKLFGTFPAKNLNYVTATVKDSLTGSFSQVSVDVKEASNDARIQSLAHARLYTPNASWAPAASAFVIKDKYDRTINLNTDNEALNYYVKVTTSNAAIVSVTSGAAVYGGGTVTFKGGNTYGTAVITYELWDDKGAAADVLLSTASAVAYNIEPKDVKTIAVTPAETPTYMTQKFNSTPQIFFTGGANTALGDAQTKALNLVGKTKDGAEVRLDTNQDPAVRPVVVTYKSTNPSFTTGSSFKANGVFTDSETTATTVASVEYNNSVTVLTATGKVNASTVKPEATEITISSDSKMRRLGRINFNNDVVKVTVDEFTALFGGKSLYSYVTNTGAEVASTAKAPVYFGASSQYGDYIIDKVEVIKHKGIGTFTVNNLNGDITIGTPVVADDEFTVTASTKNGKTKVFTIVITANPTAGSTVALASTAVLNFEALGGDLTTAAGIDAVITNAGALKATAQAAVTAITAAADSVAKSELQGRLNVKDAAATAKVTARTNVYTKAADVTVTTAAGLGLAAINVTGAVDANLAAYKLFLNNVANANATCVQIQAAITAANTAAGDTAVATALTAVEALETKVTAMNTAAGVDAAILDNGTAAQTAVTGLADSAAKTTLQSRIDAAKTTITAANTKLTLIKGMDALNSATSLTQADINGVGIATAPGGFINVAANIALYKVGIANGPITSAVDVQAVVTAANALVTAGVTLNTQTGLIANTADTMEYSINGGTTWTTATALNTTLTANQLAVLSATSDVKVRMIANPATIQTFDVLVAAAGNTAAGATYTRTTETLAKVASTIADGDIILFRSESAAGVWNNWELFTLLNTTPNHVLAATTAPTLANGKVQIRVISANNQIGSAAVEITSAD